MPAICAPKCHFRRLAGRLRQGLTLRSVSKGQPGLPPARPAGVLCDRYGGPSVQTLSRSVQMLGGIGWVGRDAQETERRLSKRAAAVGLATAVDPLSSVCGSAVPSICQGGVKVGRGSPSVHSTDARFSWSVHSTDGLFCSVHSTEQSCRGCSRSLPHYRKSLKTLEICDGLVFGGNSLYIVLCTLYRTQQYITANCNDRPPI